MNDSQIIHFFGGLTPFAMGQKIVQLFSQIESWSVCKQAKWVNPLLWFPEHTHDAS